MLNVNDPSSIRSARPPDQPIPEIRAVSFVTSTIRTGRVAVAKIDCPGIRPEAICCESVRPDCVAEVLPDWSRQGRFVILAIRIHRELDTPSGLCLLRFSAGSASSLASLTVLS